MTKTKEPAVLLAFASWEDRFVRGILKDLDTVSCAQLLVFYFSSYNEKTKQPRAQVQEKCSARGIDYKEFELDLDHPHKNLRNIDEAIKPLGLTSPFIVDISTMPREIIWSIFWLSEEREGSLRYRYYSPKSYSNEWLSRDPGRPRLVHKLSGIALPQAKTALLVSVGYDFQRVWQLIRFFEPSKLIIGLQAESPFPDNDGIMQHHVEELRVGNVEKLRVGKDCSTFRMNAYQEGHGYRSIETEIDALVDDHNIILSSLGPKLTAVSLYRIQRQWPQIGLVYVPAKQFNMEYSCGIGKLFEGVLKTVDS